MRVYKALSAPEQAELQRENEELKEGLELSRREGAELKAHINELRGALCYYTERLDENTATTVLNRAPAQSLHDFCARCTSGERGDRDMGIAERVREACLEALRQYMWNLGERWWNFECIRNLDLSEVIKDA